MESAKKKISHITNIDVPERELGNEDAFLGKLEIFEMRLLASLFMPVRPSVCLREKTRLPLNGFLMKFDV